MSEKQSTFYWKGKKVTAKVYKKRCQQQQIGKKIQKIFKAKNELNNLKSDESKSKIVEPTESRRIVHIETLAEHLFCKQCKITLSLKNIVHEKRVGLASIFYVRCNMCSKLTSVYTDKEHDVGDVSKQIRHFDTNTKAVTGLYIRNVYLLIIFLILCHIFNFMSYF